MEEKLLHRLENEALGILLKVSVTTTSSVNDDIHPINSCVDTWTESSAIAQNA